MHKRGPSAAGDQLAPEQVQFILLGLGTAAVASTCPAWASPRAFQGVLLPTPLPTLGLEERLSRSGHLPIPQTLPPEDMPSPPGAGVQVRDESQSDSVFWGSVQHIV